MTISRISKLKDHLKRSLILLTPGRTSNLITLLKEYHVRFGDFTIVETGTIRDTSARYELGDGHSTKHICTFVKEHPHCVFYSIDLHTDVCNDYLKKKNLRQYVQLIEGNSLDILPTLSFDIAYLDSDNDSELIFKEFVIAKNKGVKLIIVDDVDPSNPELKKGIQVMEYLDAHNLKYQLLPRQLVFWNTEK